MKPIQKLLALASVVLALTTFRTARAQDKGKPEGPGRPGGKPETELPGDDKKGPRGPGLKIPRLGIPPKVELPEALKKLVEQYRTESQTFLAGQKELLKTLKGTTAEEKAKIKETLKGNREKFLTEHKELIVEIRQQISEIKKDLKNHEKPVDAGTDDGGGRRRGRN